MFKKGDKVKCVNTEGDARGVLNGDDVYEVEEDQNANNTVLIKNFHRNNGGSPRWGCKRFVLATEPVVPAKEGTIIGARQSSKKGDLLTKDNAFAGMKVYTGTFVDLPYTVHAVHAEKVEITMYRGIMYNYNLFKVAQDYPAVAAAPVAAPKGVGDITTCIDGYRKGGLVKGAQYTIKVLYEDRNLVTVVEIPGSKFSQARFDINPAAKPPRDIVVGDVVFIVPGKKDDGWVGDMDQYVGDGRAYLVKELDKGTSPHRADLEMGWWFPITSLVLPSKTATPTKELPKEDDIRELLREKKKLKGDMTHHITSFAYNNGRPEPSICIDPACYATLRYAGPLSEFAVDTQCHVRLNKQEYNIPYLNYLFNDSPWATGFITKDAEEALEKGVLMNCEVPMSQVMGAATALREGIEQRDRLPLFKELIEAGYHGNVAYLVAASCKRQGSGFVAAAPANSNHVALHTHLDKDKLISFFLNGWPAMGKQPASKVGNDYNLWGDLCGGDQEVYASFSNWFIKTAKQTSTGTGFYAVKTIKTKALYEFASLLETLVTKEK